MDYEIIGVFIALLGILISIWKIQRGNVERQKGIIDDINNTKMEIERIRTEQAETEKDLYSEIASLKQLHTTDVKELTREIKESNEKTISIEQRHHEEVMNEIKILTVNLTKMCSTWEEYRSTHKGTRITRTPIKK